MKLVKFFNWTDREFSWAWDGVTYVFPANESAMMEDWKAAHFAKHLIDRELHSEGLQVSDEKREEYLKKTVIDTDVTVNSAHEATMKILNKAGEPVGSEFTEPNDEPVEEAVTATELVPKSKAKKANAASS